MMSYWPEGRRGWVRHSSRVLLFDQDGRLLLFRVEDHSLDDPHLWIPPGGGWQAGETGQVAANRELKEETGLDLAVGPCVWTRMHRFHEQRGWLEVHEFFYVAHTERTDLSFDQMEDFERSTFREHRWWPANELADAPYTFVPRRLAALLPPIAAGRYPARPLEIGI